MFIKIDKYRFHLCEGRDDVEWKSIQTMGSKKNTVAAIECIHKRSNSDVNRIFHCFVFTKYKTMENSFFLRAVWAINFYVERAPISINCNRRTETENASPTLVQIAKFCIHYFISSGIHGKLKNGTHSALVLCDDKNVNNIRASTSASDLM